MVQEQKKSFHKVMMRWLLYSVVAVFCSIYKILAVLGLWVWLFLFRVLGFWSWGCFDLGLFFVVFFSFVGFGGG